MLLSFLSHSQVFARAMFEAPDLRMLVKVPPSPLPSPLPFHLSPLLLSLFQVDLSDNFFAGEGAQLLAKALAAQTHLTDLNLRDASLEDDGAKAVVKVRPSQSHKGDAKTHGEAGISIKSR